MADSVNLNGYSNPLDAGKQVYWKSGSRSNKTRFSYRNVDSEESSFGIEMTHHHGGGSHGGGSHGGGGVVVFCCITVSTGAAGLRKGKRK